jgi:hypothetical protein
MEALILLGVLGAGYFINEDKDKKQPLNNVVDPPLIHGSGNTIYDQNNYKDSKKYEIEKVIKNHEESMKSGTKVIDALNMDGRDTINGGAGIEYNQKIKSINGEMIDKNNFLLNDQGIKMEPFYKGSGPTQVNLEEGFTGLERHQGGYHAAQHGQRSDRDPPPTEAFQDVWVRNSGNVHGNTFSGPNSEQSRYVAGNYMTNELPFEQEKVPHIDINSDINHDIDLLHAQRNNIDNRRSLSNQKISFGGKMLSGKGIEKRGEEGQLYKHLPDADYVQTADQWLVTTGAVQAARIRPAEELKCTNRQFLNDVPTGIAAPAVMEKSANRPMFKKSTNQHLVTDTNRNVSLENKMNDNDHNKSSFFAYPNERDVTAERTYEGNIKSVFTAKTEGIYDSIKPTIKETTMDDSRNGFVGPTVTHFPEERLQDKIKATVKDTTMYEYSGNAGTGSVVAQTASDNYLRADLNPNKEIIAQGRAPTTEKTKLANGSDTINMDIKKIETDYYNPRINNQDKIYQLTTEDHPCEYTQDKDTLDNVKLSDRLDPNMLDPFRTNPYTQSLASFA